MGSSKVWRKGRWFWVCTQQNKTMSWKDHEACGAISRLTFTTKEEAMKAAYSHGRKNNHAVNAHRIA